MFIRKALLMVPVAALAIACGGSEPAAAPEAPAEGAAKAEEGAAEEGGEKAEEAKPEEGGEKAEEAKPAEEKPAE